MTANEELKAQIEAKLEAIATTTDPKEKAMLYVSLGDLYVEKLAEFVKAEDAYRRAIGLSPMLNEPVWKLVNVCAELGLPDAAMELLDQLEKAGEAPRPLALQHIDMATVCLYELEDEMRAAEHYERAVMLDPTQHNALEALEEIYKKTGRWMRLCQAYEKILEKLGAEQDDLSLALLKELGRIYDMRLDNRGLATQALERASRIKPDDLEVVEQLSELYATSFDHYADAAAAHEKLLRHSPERVSSYAAMYRIFRQMQNSDRAWCCAGALMLLKQPEQDSEEFFVSRRQLQPPDLKQPMNPELLTLLRHRYLDPHLTRMLTIVTPQMLSAHGTTFDDLELKSRNHIDLSKRRPFNELFNQILAQLQLDPVEVFVRKGDIAFHHPLAVSPCLVFNQDIHKEKDPKKLSFWMGRSLAYFLPDYYLAAILPEPVLQSTVLACLKLADPDLNVESARLPVEVMAKRLRDGLSEQACSELEQIVQTLKHSKRQLSVRLWLEAAEMTVNRFALLVCGDLLDAVEALATVPASTSNLNPADAIKDLTAFSVSSAFATLRKTLGITVPV